MEKLRKVYERSEKTVLTKNTPEIRVRTRIGVTQCKYAWSIENFSTYSFAEGQFFTSPPFKTGITPWSLVLYPRGTTHYQRHVGLYLKRLTPSYRDNSTSSDYAPIHRDGCVNNSNTVNVRAMVAIETYDGRISNVLKSDLSFTSPEIKIGWCEFISIDDLSKSRNGFLLNDTLTIVCELLVTGSVGLGASSQQTDDETPETKLADLQPLCNDFKSLCEIGRFSDFSLKVDDRKLPVHRAILAARSPVFSAILEDDMLGKNKDHVEIQGVTIDVLKSIIVFIYCGQVEDLTHELAMDLFAAADRLALEDLKGKCRRYLSFRLSVVNVCEVALFAERQRDAELQKDTEQFFSSNAAPILQTADWQQLKKKNPILASELLQSIASSAMSVASSASVRRIQ